MIAAGRRPAAWTARLGPRGWALLAALAAAAALQTLVAKRTPVGSIVDDAVYLLLARALRHGAYVLPDGFGFPITSYWPGAPLLWSLPVWLCEPRWGACRIAALAVSWSALGLVWRCARRFLSPGRAAAVLLLTAFNPVFVADAGMCGSDIPFLALSLAAFAALPRGRERRRPGALELAAAAAGLMRPEGLLLIGALALAVAWREGRGRALRFAALAAAPAAVWLLRNHLASGSASDYLRQLGSQMPVLWDATSELDQVIRLVGLLFGRGLLGLSWDPLALLVGALALAAAGAGAVAGLRRQEDPRLLALAAYTLASLVLHLLWWQILDRYLLPLLPFVWILVIMNLESRPALARRPGIPIAGAALLAALIAADARALPRAQPTEPWPKTMTWVREKVAPEAVLQSPVAPVVMLWTGRRAVAAFNDATLRDHWLAMCLYNRVEYLVLDEDLARWRHMPGPWLGTLASLNAWARSSPYVTEAFRDEREGTAVYRVHHPDPARYLKAWEECRAAMIAPRTAGLGFVRDRLRHAVRLEPELAAAWAALSQIDPEPEASADLRRALRADPTLRPPAAPR